MRRVPPDSVAVFPEFLKQSWAGTGLPSALTEARLASEAFVGAASRPSRPCRSTCQKLRSRSTKPRCRAPVPRSASSAITGRVTWRVEGVKSVGDNESGARGRTRAGGRTVRRRCAGAANSGRGGGLAGSILRVVSRATHRPTLLRARHPSPHPAIGRTSYPDHGCRPCIRVWRTWFDARMHSRPGACHLEAPETHT